MEGIALAVLARAWPFILSAALALGAYFYAEKACWNDACHSQRARADKLEADNKAAHERASALAMLWAGTLDQSEKATHDALQDQAEKFAAIQEAASRLSTLPSIVISGDALRVFDSASALANAAPAPQVDYGASQALSESQLAAKWSEAGEAYADAVTKLHACINTYNSLRESQ